MNLCEVPACDRPIRARGLCATHWARWRKHGDTLATTPVRTAYAGTACAVAGCDKAAKARGWCIAHWERWRRWGDPLGQPPPHAPETCDVDGCERTRHAGTFCTSHYSRWRRYGDPLAGGPMRARGPADYEQRFWARVDKDGPVPERVPALGPCWIWQGAPNPKGYGSFMANGKTSSAHRFAYTAVLGPIADGLQLHHRCDNPPCVNPGHLEPLTPAAHGVMSRKTHCKRGHERTPENSYVQYACRLCALERASHRD